MIDAATERAEVWAEKACRMAQPVISRLYGIRRRLATGAVALLAIWLFVHVIFAANGMAVYRAKRAEYQNLEREIGRLEKETDRYTGEINQLKSDPHRIEKEAREQFHYARPGEVIYVSPEPSPPQPAESSSAKK
jgi:cell division protein FtsB